MFSHTYNDIISVENLLCAWREFERGKKHKEDVMEYKRHLMKNIFSLHTELQEKTYKHGTYKHFIICDPKRRDIHKACVQDRLLHHAIYRQLYPFFDRTFIADSYSCRDTKGTHRALRRLEYFARKVSKNHTRTCWVLKCDIRKFFASIDHELLIQILESRIGDTDIINLLKNVIESFFTQSSQLKTENSNKGLPLGNLTSQLFVNIYMNEFDQHMKHVLKAMYYMRYADDFVILSESREDLELLRQKIEDFLTQNLHLSLHPHKVSIETFASGVDFLGWVHFPDHKVLRTTTKRKMIRRVGEKNLASYLGLLSHGNGYKVSTKVMGMLKNNRPLP